MRHIIQPIAVAAVVLTAALLVLPAPPASAAVQGVPVTTGAITLTAKADYVTSADGGSIQLWGLTNGAGRAQYPGPTLILDQGDTITVTLNNQLAEATSLVFPGHDVTACTPTPIPAGQMTCQAAAAGSATYTFTAEQPGTYLYHSGTNAALQVELGLLGAIVVRPYGFDPNNPTAYGHPDSAYDREYLFVLSEMDPIIHQMVEYGDSFAGTDVLGDYFSKYWFINGRTGPDTMAGNNLSYLPTQPYGSLVQMIPGEKILMRVVSAGRDLHPFHHHGNHARVIARNGRMLSSGPGTGFDLSYEVFTIQAVPGETYDATFEWTGKQMGWDIYGDPTDPIYAHGCTDTIDNTTGAAGADGFADPSSDRPWEWCADHGKAFPVTLPENQDLAFGGFWSGSPFMGSAEALPPGEGGLNPNSGYTYMWHSHTEKELTNNDIFPGGMMTMLIVEPPGVPIP